VIAETLAGYLDDPASGFTIGSLGAIAEFFRDSDEATQGRPGELWRASPRGAICIVLRDGIMPLAHETLSARPGLWQHGVLFCLPKEAGRGAVRTAVTELGPDRDAIRLADRTAVLFDLGLGQTNVDFCVRTDDAGLIAALRAHEGGPVGPLMGALIDASPTRVALSALGRIEVYQHIDRERSPDGPHSHVLPPLLKSGRTHSANIPVPEGWLPCLALYPPHPLFDILGRGRPFEPKHHASFQSLLDRWGDAHYLAEKRRVEDAMEHGLPGYAEPTSRVGRLACRVAIRQRMQIDPTAAQPWADRFD
jgi:hypothetical protein